MKVSTIKQLKCCSRDNTYILSLAAAIAGIIIITRMHSASMAMIVSWSRTCTINRRGIWIRQTSLEMNNFVTRTYIDCASVAMSESAWEANAYTEGHNRQTYWLQVTYTHTCISISLLLLLPLMYTDSADYSHSNIHGASLKLFNVVRIEGINYVHSIDYVFWSTSNYW